MNVWHHIIEIAARTPSPHNVQPWKFKIHNAEKATLYLDSKRTLPKEDITGSFITSAMGMMLEAIAIIAANHKYKLSYNIVYDVNSALELIPFAELVLEEDSSLNSEYDNNVFLHRRTSRLKYFNKPIAQHMLDNLSALTNMHGYEFGYTNKPDLIEKILNLNIRAVFEDLNDSNYHDEIEGYFRYTNKQSERFKDGLDYKCMNMPKHEMFIGGKLPKLLMLPVIRKILFKIYRRRIGYVGCIGWISGKFWDTQNAVESGRMLISFWLEMAKHDLYFHPFGNLVTNKNAARQVEKDLSKENIWLIFKLGYSGTPPESLRLPLKELIIK